MADGLITVSRTVNNRPYLASELKAAHGAASINVVADVGKPKVVIATTIAYNWSPTYIQTCADAYCYAYGLAPRPIEVINLDENGNKVNDSNPAVTQPVLDAIDTWFTTNGGTQKSGVTGVTVNDRRASLNGIMNLPNKLHELTGGTESEFTSEQNDMFGWLGELILNFWAIGMNPNAHFRVVCSHNAIGTSLNQAIVYASTDANFSNPFGPTHYVNMSWGDSMPGFDSASLDDSIFINPRICYFAAAGNYRWAGYPATSHNVLCAGGASLLYDSTNLQVNVWGNTNTPSSINAEQGGGTGFSHSIVSGSNFYPRPFYQNGLIALPDNNRRACPDMCSLGDPNTGVLLIFSSSNGDKLAKRINGGTSLASPLLCGLFSHLSQRRINAGVVPLTTRMTDVGSTSLSGSQNLQDFVYINFINSPVVASSMFYDITNGATRLAKELNLGPENSEKTFAAASGHDIATGLGFPLLEGIMNRMFPVQTVNPGVGVPTINPSTVQGLLTPRAVFNFNQQPQ